MLRFIVGLIASECGFDCENAGGTDDYVLKMVTVTLQIMEDVIPKSA